MRINTPSRRTQPGERGVSRVIACALSRRLAPLLLSLTLVGCATSSPSSRDTRSNAGDASTTDWSEIESSFEATGNNDVDGSRLIVVTFEAGAQRGLPRPGSTGKGYRGSSRAYKTLPTSVRTSNKLAESYGLVRVDDWPIALLDVHCVVYAVSGELPIGEIIQEMEDDPRVKTVQPLHEFRVLGQYDDPYLSHQTGLAQMQIERAHTLATGDGVRVAVIDTGVDLDHPDLKRTIQLARDCVATPRSGRCRDAESDHASFSSDAHGTGVAGVIASLAGNGEGIVGVAPGVELLALKACWYPRALGGVATGTGAVCNTFTLAKAIQLAIDEGADILNLSLTGPRDPLLHEMIGKSLDLGAIVVGAVRAEDVENGVANGFPGSHDRVITVETTASSNARFAADVVRQPPAQGDPLRAPGDNILTTQPGGKYDFVTGSSFAAAHVSGLAALLLERDPIPGAKLRELPPRHVGLDTGSERLRCVGGTSPTRVLHSDATANRRQLSTPGPLN